MSTHPNAILLMILKPDDLARKTARNIITECGDGKDNDYITIGNYKYHLIVMEKEYNECYQIAADEGDILIFDLITYGYGEKILWEKINQQKIELDSWAKDACNKFNFIYEIYITANYW